MTSQGKKVESARASLSEAIELYVETSGIPSFAKKVATFHRRGELETKSSKQLFLCTPSFLKQCGLKLEELLALL